MLTRTCTHAVARCAALALAMSLLACQSVLEGVPIEGEPVVFVLDVSGSMAGLPEPLAAKVGNRAVEVATRQARSRIPAEAAPVVDLIDSLLPAGRPALPVTKLDVAKRELAEVIERLPASTRFSIITFSDDVRAWQRQTVTASPSSKRAAREFVSSLLASGATNLGGALDTALSMQELRSIVLVTDGAATDRDASSILRKVRSDAAARGIRITTVGLGPDQDEALLGNLARSSGGRYFKR